MYKFLNILLKIVSSIFLSFLIIFHLALIINSNPGPELIIPIFIIPIVIFLVNKYEFNKITKTFKYLAIAYPTLIISFLFRFLFEASIVPEKEKGCLIFGFIFIGIIIGGAVFAGTVFSILLMLLSKWLDKKSSR